jgi:hypothetical protein
MLHAPRGPFYSPKRPRCRWSLIWKALVASVCRCTILSGGAQNSSCAMAMNYLIGHLPSRVGTRMSGGAPYTSCATVMNHLIDQLPFWVGTGLSDGTLERSRDLPDRCGDDMVGADRVADRWRRRRVVARLAHQTCSVIFSQQGSPYSQERLVWTSRPG